jgi:hypothetical protein
MAIKENGRSISPLQGFAFSGRFPRAALRCALGCIIGAPLALRQLAMDSFLFPLELRGQFLP